MISTDDIDDYYRMYFIFLASSLKDQAVFFFILFLMIFSFRGKPFICINFESKIAFKK